MDDGCGRPQGMHLNESVRNMVTASRDERISSMLIERYVAVHQHEEIKKELRNNSLRITGTASNCSINLVGNSGVGKTELLKEIRRSISEECSSATNQEVKSLVRPFMLVSLDRCSTEIDFVNGLSIDLVDRRLTQRTVREELRVTIDRLNRADIGALLIDEAQDLGQGSRTDQIKICQCVRYLTNRFKHPVVIASTVIAAEIFNMDQNLATRFHQRRLEPWTEGLELRDFVLNYCMWLPLQKPPEFSPENTEEILKTMVDVTGGSTRLIVRLLQSAAIQAIGREECICLESIKRASP